MTRRRKALLLLGPSAAALPVLLGWWALDPKGDTRGQLIDRGVRLLDGSRALLDGIRTAARL